AYSTTDSVREERLTQGHNSVDAAIQTIVRAVSAATPLALAGPRELATRPRSTPVPAPTAWAMFATGIMFASVNTTQRKNQATKVWVVWRSTASWNLRSRFSNSHSMDHRPYPTPDRPTPPSSRANSAREEPKASRRIIPANLKWP